jgi:O-methyltransferase
MIKEIIKKIFISFGIKISKNDPGVEILNTNDYISFAKKDKDYRLYKEGLRKSENTKSDNIQKKIRFNYIIQLTQYILKKKKIYNFAECGCWKGHSSFIIAKLISKSKKKIQFDIFDSFEGLSNVTKFDRELNRMDSKEKKYIKNQFSSDENFIKNNVLKKFPFCKTYKGWIPSRFNEVKNQKFSFVHIDVDLYEPTLESLKFFFPRLVKGGVIICDDYNSKIFDGAKKAWDKYFKNKKLSNFIKNPIGGCFLIK